MSTDGWAVAQWGCLQYWQKAGNIKLSYWFGAILFSIIRYVTLPHLPRPTMPCFQLLSSWVAKSKDLKFETWSLNRFQDHSKAYNTMYVWWKERRAVFPAQNDLTCIKTCKTRTVIFTSVCVRACMCNENSRWGDWTQRTGKLHCSSG